MGHATLFLTIAVMVVQLGSSWSVPRTPWTVSRPVAEQSSTVDAASPLDFEVYRTKVQPILISPRKGNARCAACHPRGGGNAYLEPLSPGATTYTDEQSQRNFQRISRLVLPGEPLKSILLTNPLATDAGGSQWHEGGKHWISQNDTEWQTLAAWVRGS